MVLVVETGAGLVDANSYADVAFADQYFSSHPFYADSWADLDTSKKAFLLISASSDLDATYDWRGTPTTKVQGLRWPRTNAYTLDDRLIARNAIPTNLKKAVCEQARYLSSAESNPDASVDTGGVTELKVDVITLKFGDSTSVKSVPKGATRWLRGLGIPYGASRVRKVQVDL